MKRKGATRTRIVDGARPPQFNPEAWARRVDLKLTHLQTEIAGVSLELSMLRSEVQNVREGQETARNVHNARMMRGDCPI